MNSQMQEWLKYAETSTLRVFLTDLKEKFNDFSNELLTSDLFKNFDNEKLNKTRRILNWMTTWLENDMKYLENQKFQYLDWMWNDEDLEDYDLKWKKILDSTLEEIKIFEEVRSWYDEDWVLSKYIFYIWEIWFLFLWLQTMISLEREFTTDEKIILNKINTFFREFCNNVIISEYEIYKFNKEEFTFNHFISYLLNDSDFWYWFKRSWMSDTTKWFLEELSKEDLEEYDEESDNFEEKWVTIWLCY